jgi:hypothetical protein
MIIELDEAEVEALKFSLSNTAENIDCMANGTDAPELDDEAIQEYRDELDVVNGILVKLGADPRMTNF